MNLSTEPVATAGGAAAAVSAVIALLVAFGVHLTADQTAAILGVVGVVAPVVTSLLARSKVHPASKQPDAQAKANT